MVQSVYLPFQDCITLGHLISIYYIYHHLINVYLFVASQRLEIDKTRFNHPLFKPGLNSPLLLLWTLQKLLLGKLPMN